MVYTVVFGINSTHNAVRKCEIALGFASHYFTLPVTALLVLLLWYLVIPNTTVDHRITYTNTVGKLQSWILCTCMHVCKQSSVYLLQLLFVLSILDRRRFLPHQWWHLAVDCSRIHTGAGHCSRIVAAPNSVLKLIVAAGSA